MGFPPTRLTLVRRIAAGGSEEDWQQFLEDYWGPICRFVTRRTGMSWHDAEDVASATFEILLRNRLLAQWQADRSARLRNLICGVVRKQLATIFRTDNERRELLQNLIRQDAIDRSVLNREDWEVSADPEDLFYAAWVEDLLQQSMEGLRHHLFRRGKGDHFRVLYGRLCEDLTREEISQLLGLSLASVDNRYRTARVVLERELKARIARYVRRYCTPTEMQSEFLDEWNRLGEHLFKQGGLEASLRQAFLQSIPDATCMRRSDSFSTTAGLLRMAVREERARADRQTPNEASGSPESAG
ncbi:MAG: sigma-70 family RNA polymerase sigma factor [Rhodopirellula sp.]|nr:sigma-70 family RNA polymerase sigma factor [Rhodopirellula sp.]